MSRTIFSLVHLGTAIHNINRISERRYGLSLAQWCLLKSLRDMPGVSALLLAKSVRVHPSTLTQSLKRLKGRGYIQINSHPNDSRKKIIFLTRHGKSVLDRLDKFLSAKSRHIVSLESDLERIRRKVEQVFP